MKKIKLDTKVKEIFADCITPVTLYLKLRDKYPNSLLLESSDYHGNKHSYSYICCYPIAKFEVSNNKISTQYPNQKQEIKPIQKKEQVVSALNDFRQTFQTEELDYPMQAECSPAAMFGFTSYDGVQYFEDIELTQTQKYTPEILYQVFGIVICIDHFRDKLFVFEQQPVNQQPRNNKTSILETVTHIIQNQSFASYPFFSLGKEMSNYKDKEFLQIIDKGIEHCNRGDVFQIVLSRRFWQDFRGDEFNVYRALRSINPSPYLFYFDYGNFRIFGSSPEAQIVIEKNEATIYPIAGTFKRTGNDKKDSELAKKLFDDPKETAEHCMLVDLARNDLSRQGTEVKVESFKEIQYYSHVIHMVSKVVAKIEKINPLQLFADTFPAGTLSGAPKHRAMQLIQKYESLNRGFYAGAIGYIRFNGDINHAIMIRTILSQKNRLYYQAGGGIVSKSNPQSELQEANNKRAALKSAIEMAHSYFSK